eukprot:9349189-Alexandrium_andersonii.AAC.1
MVTQGWSGRCIAWQSEASDVTRTLARSGFWCGQYSNTSLPGIRGEPRPGLRCTGGELVPSIMQTELVVKRGPLPVALVQNAEQ